MLSYRSGGRWGQLATQARPVCAQSQAHVLPYLASCTPKHAFLPSHALRHAQKENSLSQAADKCTQDEGVSEVPLPRNQGRLPWVEGVSCRAFVGWPERRGIPPAPVQWSALLGA